MSTLNKRWVFHKYDKNVKAVLFKWVPEYQIFGSFSYPFRYGNNEISKGGILATLAQCYQPLFYWLNDIFYYYHNNNQY